MNSTFVIVIVIVIVFRFDFAKLLFFEIIKIQGLFACFQFIGMNNSSLAKDVLHFLLEGVLYGEEIGVALLKEYTVDWKILRLTFKPQGRTE